MTSIDGAEDDTEIVFSDNINDSPIDNTQGIDNDSDNQGSNMDSNLLQNKNDNDSNHDNNSNNSDNKSKEQSQSGSSNINNDGGSPISNGKGSEGDNNNNKKGGPPKLLMKNSGGDAEIKYEDDPPHDLNIDVSSDLDSDIENKMQGASNLTPNHGDTPNGGQTPQSGSRPLLKPSASQQARNAKDYLSPSPKSKRPELQPATTSSKKPILDIHDIRHFARNFESAREVRDYSIEMGPNFTDNNDAISNVDDGPPDVSDGGNLNDDSGGGSTNTSPKPKNRLNSTSTIDGGTPNNSTNTTGGMSGSTSNGEFKEHSPASMIERLRNDRNVEEPMCLVGEWLYLGNSNNAGHITQIKNLQITHILNVTDTIPNYFQDSKELNWIIDYAQIPIPNKEYSLIYDYFKAAVQFIDLCNPDEDTGQIEKEISRNDRRSERYDFDDGGMVVLSGSSSGGGGVGGGNGGAGSGGDQGGASSAGALDVLTEGKEIGNGDDSNIGDPNDMEFAFDSDNDGDYETPNENSRNNNANMGNYKHGLANSIELGQNIDHDTGEPIHSSDEKSNKKSQQKKPNNNNNTASPNSKNNTKTSKKK